MFAARLTLLIGPAGTGKTTLLEALVSLAEVKDHGVLLLTPTGKARVVLAEHTGVQAETIAQALLRVERYDPATGAYALRGKAPYLEGYRTVIIDECSMLTESQLVATLDALRGVQRLILVAIRGSCRRSELAAPS